MNKRFITLMMCLFVLLSVGFTRTWAMEEPDAETPSAEEVTEVTEGPIEGEEVSDPELEQPAPEQPSTLYQQLMACSTSDEAMSILEVASEEEIAAMSEEEIANAEAYINALLDQEEAEKEAAKAAEKEKDKPVESEIIYPIVNFDNVAPFVAPVEG